jgi:protein-tyrosine-phosphatase
VDEVTEMPDLVVTVCDIAREELHALKRDARLLHWSIPDPAKDPSSDAFDRALRTITARVDTPAPHVRAPHRPRRSRS